MKYRSRTDIVVQILDAARDLGSTKTRIMFKAYLSHAQLKEYLSLMLENGLLKYMQGEKRFKTTEKGMKFLRLHQDINALAGFRQEKAVK
jgi:predicted transcriptional regulator